MSDITPTEAMKEKAREIRSQLIYCAGECCTSEAECGCMNEILTALESVRAEADAAATERANNLLAILRVFLGEFDAFWNDPVHMKHPNAEAFTHLRRARDNLARAIREAGR